MSKVLSLFGMNTPPPHRNAPSGKSLLEILIVVVIIALLVTLAFPLAGYFKAKASYAACVSSMKSLHGGFAAFLGDHQMIWPQVPDGLDREGEHGDMLAKFWYDALRDYGIPKKTWVCSADERLKDFAEDEKHYESTYTITEFDDQPNRAYQWVAQPWIIESGEFHGKGVGPNVIFPDGHIERGIPLSPSSDK